MLKRTLSTVVLWLLVLACLYWGGPVGAACFIAGVSVLTLHEFYTLVAGMGHRPFRRLGLVLGAAITLAPLWAGPYLGAGDLLALATIVFSVRILGERTPDARIESLAWTVFGLIYVPFMLQFLVRVLLLKSPRPETGLVLGLWLVVAAKFCDTGALLTGLTLGRHRLAPDISPKKTWEGVAGGVLLSVAAGTALAWWFRPYLPARFTPPIAAALALAISILAIVSDLVESIVKRRANLKDAGRTIPGIGGVFDLVDSLLLAAPLGWVVLHLL